MSEVGYEAEKSDELSSARDLAAKLSKAPGRAPPRAPRWLSAPRRERWRGWARSAFAWTATVAIVGAIIATAAHFLAG